MLRGKEMFSPRLLSLVLHQRIFETNWRILPHHQLVEIVRLWSPFQRG